MWNHRPMRYEKLYMYILYGRRETEESTSLTFRIILYYYDCLLRLDDDKGAFWGTQNFEIDSERKQDAENRYHRRLLMILQF